MRLIVCLDAGHSQGEGVSGDPGAVNGIYKESVIAMDIVYKLGSMFESRGHSVVYTRFGAKPSLTLADRCRIANNNKADVFVSVHLNSAEDMKANGIETLRYEKVGERTKRLAAEIQNALVHATGWRDRGVKIRNDLYVLKHTAMPAVLVEAGFISNDRECDALNREEVQYDIAEAIFNAVIDVFRG